MYLILSLTVNHVRAEVPQCLGRPDAVIATSQYIYVLEYKVTASADVALLQIDKKHYCDPYLGLGKKVIKVGIHFDTTLRNISEWKSVEVK